MWPDHLFFSLITYHAFLNRIQSEAFVQQREAQRKPDLPFSFLFLILIQLQYNARYKLPYPEYARKDIIC